MTKYDLYNTDLAAEIMKAGKQFEAKAKAKGATGPLFSKCDPIPFNPYVGLEGKQEKYLKTDAILISKLDTFKSGDCKKIFDNLLKLINSRIDTYASNWKDDAAAFNELGTGIYDQILRHGHIMQEEANKILEEYLAQVNAGKLAKRKYQMSAGKSFLKIGASVAAVGITTAGAVGSHGATAPAVVLALYATYKSTKELIDTLKAYATDMDKHLEHARKTLDKITKEYNGSTWKTAKGELIAKAANEFLKIQTESIKKLENDIKHFARHVDMSFTTVHKMGKNISKIQKETEESAKELAKNEEAMNKAKKLLPEAVVNAWITKINTAEAKLKATQAEIPNMIKKAVDLEALLKNHKSVTIPGLEKSAAELKEKRPGWIAQAGNVMKLPVILASAACMDYSNLVVGGMTMVNEVVGMSAAAITDFITSYDKQATNAAKKATAKK